MTLWSPPIRSDRPLAPVWRALARHNVGVDHYCDATGWRLTVERLVRRPDGYARVQVTDITGPDDIDVVIAALPVLPGLRTRLALLCALV